MIGNDRNNITLINIRRSRLGKTGLDHDHLLLNKKIENIEGEVDHLNWIVILGVAHLHTKAGRVHQRSVNVHPDVITPHLVSAIGLIVTGGNVTLRG
mgnify:CR=1 FL=1